MSDELFFSPGLEGVIAGETAISTLAGGLSYRGYQIEDLATHSCFDEVAFLILHGELPRGSELEQFRQRIADYATLPATIVETLRSIPTTAPMMDVMRTGASLLAHWDDEVGDSSPAANLRKAERLLVRLPLVLGAAQRLRGGHDPLTWQSSLPFAGNVLWLLTGRQPTADETHALDATLIMYAEHEYNASTFAARVVVSTLSDLHSAITAGIGALKGALHGGANERVLEVLQAVGSPERAEAWVRDALSRKVRIMGFGHRVYKNGDVRAKYLKPLCQKLATAAGHEALERTAAVMERIVEQEKGLMPNLDWPTARIYHYLSLPVELYTPLFVISRITGWSAHIIEQLANNRLIRPRSRYTGPDTRTWVPLEDRR